MDRFKVTIIIAVLALTTVDGVSAQYSPESERPPRAEVESPIASPGSFRLDVQAYIGGAGRTVLFVDGEERAKERMTATFGIQVQGLVPIAKYVLVGPAFSLRSLHGSGASDRLNVYGFDLAFGAHYGVALTGSIAIDPYVLFTLGLAVASAERSALSEDTEFGIGVGVRAGATLWFDHAFGVRFGFGHQSVHLRPSSEAFGGDARVRLRELASEAGISFRFGN